MAYEHMKQLELTGQGAYTIATVNLGMMFEMVRPVISRLSLEKAQIWRISRMLCKEYTDEDLYLDLAMYGYPRSWSGVKPSAFLAHKSS